MTLARQLIIAVVLLFVVLYAGNLMVTLFNTQALVDEQMQIHAQDTATAVAISMTQAAQQNDIATLETLFNAVSDSGFYQRIFFTSLDGDTVIDRTFPVRVEGVPDWFVRLVDLNTHEGRAEVTSGWNRLGEVVVVSHPGKAYAELWAVMVAQFWWFFGVTLAVCLATFGALRWLLVPLGRVERQADAICQQDFQIQEKLPRTRELRRVVEAMNRMSSRLASIFESQLDLIKRLQAQAFRDPVTGLANRAEFDARLNSLIKDPEGPFSGAVVIMALSDISALNERFGRPWGNKLLKELGMLASERVSELPGAVVARRQGLEFSLLLTGVGQERIRELVASLHDAAVRLVSDRSQGQSLHVDIGYCYQDAITDAAGLLTHADTALRNVIAGGQSGWLAFSPELAEASGLTTRSAAQWRAFIENHLASSSLQLLHQGMHSTVAGVTVGCEVFSRFPDGDRVLSPAVVLAHAEQLGLAAQLDLKVIELLAGRQWRDDGDVAVNLSGDALRSDGFVEELEALLAASPAFASRLVFEIPEQRVQQDEARVRAFHSRIAPLGIRLALDHFGLQSSSFSYLRSLPLAYVKVHRSFTAGIDSNLDNQFYLKSLHQLVSSRDIHLVAEGVENEAQLQALQTLGIEYVQGFFLSRPEPF